MPAAIRHREIVVRTDVGLALSSKLLLQRRWIGSSREGGPAWPSGRPGFIWKSLLRNTILRFSKAGAMGLKSFQLFHIPNNPDECSSQSLFPNLRESFSRAARNPCVVGGVGSRGVG